LFFYFFVSTLIQCLCFLFFHSVLSRGAVHFGHCAIWICALYSNPFILSVYCSEGDTIQLYPFTHFPSFLLLISSLWCFVGSPCWFIHIFLSFRFVPLRLTKNVIACAASPSPFVSRHFFRFISFQFPFHHVSFPFVSRHLISSSFQFVAFLSFPFVPFVVWMKSLCLSLLLFHSMHVPLKP